MTSLNHFVLIRFNAHNTDKNWLDHRLKYFRGFTAPSLKAQTEKNFKTILWVDPSTPSDVIRELEAIGIVFKNGNKPLGRTLQYVLSSDISALIKSLCSKDSMVITSRLDSDDAFAKDYIERTQRLAIDIKQELVNRQNRTNKLYQRKYIVYPKGILWDSSRGKFFRKDENSPAFGSMVELVGSGNPHTVLNVNHAAIVKQNHPHVVWANDLKWLQSFHDRNLLNHIETEAIKPSQEMDYATVRNIIGDITVENL
ncbi:MAG: putative rhamnosyl transferase [Nitrososphaera sp.]|nr:putative rhamnosyl transferase [Nitrososphaera sp.]